MDPPAIAPVYCSPLHDNPIEMLRLVWVGEINEDRVFKSNDTRSVLNTDHCYDISFVKYILTSYDDIGHIWECDACCAAR